MIVRVLLEVVDVGFGDADWTPESKDFHRDASMDIDHLDRETVRVSVHEKFLEMLEEAMKKLPT